MALSAAATEFRALNIPQRRLAQLFAVTPRHVRRWKSGDRHIPHAVAIVLRLLVVKAVTIDQIEQIAAPVPAQTNGGAAPEPPASLLVEPAPVQAQAQTALAVACRWPIGDPRHPDFRFCGRPTTAPPYCNEHRIAAHMTPPVGGNLAARPPRTGFGRPSPDVGGTRAASVALSV